MNLWKVVFVLLYAILNSVFFPDTLLGITAELKKCASSASRFLQARLAACRQPVCLVFPRIYILPIGAYGELHSHQF